MLHLCVLPAHDIHTSIDTQTHVQHAQTCFMIYQERGNKGNHTSYAFGLPQESHRFERLSGTIPQPSPSPGSFWRTCSSCFPCQMVKQTGSPVCRTRARQTANYFRQFRRNGAQVRVRIVSISLGGMVHKCVCVWWVSLMRRNILEKSKQHSRKLGTRTAKGAHRAKAGG